MYRFRTNGHTSDVVWFEEKTVGMDAMEVFHKNENDNNRVIHSLSAARPKNCG